MTCFLTCDCIQLELSYQQYSKILPDILYIKYSSKHKSIKLTKIAQDYILAHSPHMVMCHLCLPERMLISSDRRFAISKHVLKHCVQGGCGCNENCATSSSNTTSHKRTKTIMCFLWNNIFQ